MGPVAAFRQSRGDLVPFADVGRARWRGEDAEETLSDRGGASLRGGWVVWWMGQAPSGRRWQGSQPSEGATELGFPGPVLGKMQSEAAGLAGEAAGQREEAPSEGLGGNHLLAQTDARCPGARLWAITPYRVRGRLWTASQAALAAKRPDGRWLRPTPYLKWRSRPRHGGDGRPPVPGYLRRGR